MGSKTMLSAKTSNEVNNGTQVAGFNLKPVT